MEQIRTVCFITTEKLYDHTAKICVDLCQKEGFFKTLGVFSLAGSF